MNAIIEHINSAGYAFVEFAAAMLIQSGLLILLLLLADFALRKRVRAVFRYWIWMLVLVKLLLPTSLSGPFSLGYWLGDEIASVDVSHSTSEAQLQAGEAPVPVLPHIIDLSKVRPPIYLPSVTPLPGETDLAPAESTALPSVPAVPITWQGVVFLLWLAVAAVMLLLLGQRAIFVRGLVAQAKNANRPMLDTLDQCRKSMKIKRAVTVKISPNATSPAVCGLWRPVILIPHNMPAALGSADLRVVLLHELAHVKRGDLWVNLIQTLLQIVYFYNPLLWLANAVIRRAREQAVDEAVLVVMGEKASQYPQTLVSVAKLAFKRPTLSLRLIGVVESKSALTARIKRILNRPIPKSAKLGILGLLAVIIAAVVLLPMTRAEREIRNYVRPHGFQATLPGGVTVELVGVCEYPSAGRPWWQPDGSLLEEAPSENLKLGGFNTKGNEAAYELVVKVEGPKQLENRSESPDRWEVPQARKVGLGRSGLYKDRSGQRCLRATTAIVKKGLDSVDVEFGIGWQVKERISISSGEKSKQRVEGIGVVVEPPYNKNGKPAVTIKIPNKTDKRMKVGVRAVLKDGSTRENAAWSRNSKLRFAASTDNYEFAGITLSQVDHFEIFTIEYEWIEFKNVSLRSNSTTLANGVTVELIGVCEHPSEGKQWWKPDGDELLEAPYDEIGGNVYPDGDEKSFEFAIRLGNLPAEHVNTKVGCEESVGGSAGGGSSPGKAGEYLSDFRWLATTFPKKLKACTVKVGVAAGQWQPVAKSNGKGFGSRGSELGGVSFTKAFEVEDGISITVADDILGRPCRVVAITNDGEVVKPVRSSGSSAGKARQTTAKFNNISLSDIKEFQFQTRPYEWVEFKNVSLRPGVQTDVQVEVEGSPDGGSGEEDQPPKPVTASYEKGPGSKNLKIKVGPTTFKVNTVVRWDGTGNPIFEDGRGKPPGDLGFETPDYSTRALWMDTANIYMSPEAARYDVLELRVFDHQTREMLSPKGRIGIGYDVQDSVVQLRSIGAPLPDSVDVWFRLLHNPAEDSVWKLNAKAGASVRLDRETFSVRVIKPGSWSHTTKTTPGAPSQIQWTPHQQDGTTTVAFDFSSVKRSILSGPARYQICAVTDNGKRYVPDFRPFIGTVSGLTRVINFQVPAEKLSRFEIRSFHGRDTFYFDNVKLPGIPRRTFDPPPRVTVPVNGKKTEYTSTGLDPISLNVRVLPGIAAASVQGGSGTRPARVYPASEPHGNPDTQTTAIYDFHGIELNRCFLTYLDDQGAPVTSRSTSRIAHGAPARQFAGYERVEIPIEKIAQARLSLTENDSPPTIAKTAKPCRKRYFVTLVVTDGGVIFNGQKMSWAQLEDALKEIPNRDATVLEVAVDLAIVPEGLRGSAMLKWVSQSAGFQKAAQLHQELGFEYLSNVGVDRVSSRRGPVSVRFEDALRFGEQIPVALMSFEEQPLLRTTSIEFEKAGADIRAVLKAAVTSYPKKSWEIGVRLLDGQGKQITSVVNTFENSGYAVWYPIHSQEEMNFSFGQAANLADAKRFEVKLREFTNELAAGKTAVQVEGELTSFAQECVRRIMQACDQEQPKQDYTNYITESSIYRIDSNDLTPEKKEQRIKSIIESIKERFDPNLGHNLAIAGFSDKMIVVDIYNKEKKPDVQVEVENDGEKGSQFTVTPANGVEISARERIAKIIESEKKIKDIRLQMTCTIGALDRTFYEYDWGYEDTKEFLSGTTNTKDSRTGAYRSVKVIRAFDGKREWLFRNDPKSSRPSGGITKPNPNFSFSGGIMTFNTLLGFDAKELSRLSLGQAIAQAESVSVKEQVEFIDGRPCYVIEAINLETDPSVHWSYDVRAWIDYQRAYRPLKFEKYRSIPGKNRFKVVSRRVDNIKLEQIDGIWLPIEGTRTTFSTNDIHPPKGMTAARFGTLPSEQRLQLGVFKLTPMGPMRRLEIDVESIRLNKGISPEAFTIAFPKGCEVYDEFAGNRYIVGEQSEKDAALSDAELIEQTKKLSVSELIDVLRSKSLGLSKRRWFAVIHRLVEIGPPAVAQLVAEIRKTEKPQTQSKLALTLRAIGDLNAVAGLIDALERAGFSSDYGLGEPKTELGRFYKTYQMDPAKKGLGLGRPVREITIALERLTGHSEGHDHFHAYDSAGNRLGSYTITPEIRDRQRQHRRQVAQKWRTWWQTNKDKIKPPEMPPTPPAEPKPPKPKGHEGMVLAAPEGAELTLAIVPNIGDSARQPSLTKEQYQKYLDYLAENGPFAGSVRGDSFQWLPIKGDTKNYKGLPLSAYKERTYILLCARAQYVMIPEVEGKRIWGLETVEVIRDMQGRDAISVRFDEKGAELLAKLTKANIDNHLALAVDGWVRLASVIQAPLKEAAFITGDFPAGEVRTLVEDMKKGMPVVDQQAITVMQQIAEAAEKLNKDDLAKMGPRQIVENLLVAGLAGDSEKLAWFVRGESVAAKAITIDDFAQMADGHKIKVLEVHADSSDALAVTSNIKGKSGDQEGQLIFYLSKQTGAWLIHDADVGDSEKAHENVDEFLITHPDVQVEGEGKGLADNSKVIEQAIQRSYEVSGTVFDPVPDSWWDDLFTKLEAVESEGEGRQILENVENLPGHPAAGVVVTLRGDSLTKETVTDAEGKFKFSGLPEGAYSLSCEKTVVSTRTGQKRLAVAKGDAQFNSRFPISSHKADLRLRDDYVTVKGRITDAQGRPVAGAKVTAILVVNNVAYQQYLANHDPPTWFAVSKNDGSYELQGIDPANFYHLAGYLQGGKALREYVDIHVEANGFVQDKNNIPKVPLVSEDVLYQARRLLKIFSQMSQRAGGPEYQEMDRLTFPSGSGNTITGIDIVLEQAGTAVPVEVEPSKSPPAGDLPNNQAEAQGNADEAKYEGRTIAEWIAQWDSKLYDETRAATEALIKIGRPAVPAMIEQMKKGGMRASCASGVLGKMGPEAEDAVPWLIEAALDKDIPISKGWESRASYRENVVSCLNYMTWARDRVIPVLQRIAGDDEDDTRLRRVAVLFLRDIGKEAIPILRKVTETHEDDIQDAAHHALAQVLKREQGLSKDDYYTPLIEKDPFDASVPEYLAVMKSPDNQGRPHPLTQKVKELYREQLAKEPDPELAWQLAAIIQNGLRNTDLEWAAPTHGIKVRWSREDPTENYTTLAEVLQIGFDHAESGSQLSRQFGISLAKLRLLQGDWDRMNAMLKELGQEQIPKESRQWLSAPPVDWETDLHAWRAADESMRSGECSLEFKIEKAGKGLKGVHFLVKRAPEPTNVFSTGIRTDTLFFAPAPMKVAFGSFGYGGKDRSLTRYAVSDESGIVRFDKLPDIPVKIEVLVPTSNFPEAVSNWDLWMEVEPGKFKIAKIYGGADAVDWRYPPAVVELKEGQTVHYPKLVVRPAFGFNVSDWTRVDKDNFVLSWAPMDSATQANTARCELEMSLSAPPDHPYEATHAPVLQSAKIIVEGNRWPVGEKGVGDLHLEPGNIYMFGVRALDASGVVIARWPRIRVWTPWGHRTTDPPFASVPLFVRGDLSNRPPIHNRVWHYGSFDKGTRRRDGLREGVGRFLSDSPNTFEYEYVRMGKAWLDWHDDRQDARRQLEKLVKELPEGNVARGTALWMIQQIDQNKEPPKRLNFVPDRETSRPKTTPPSM